MGASPQLSPALIKQANWTAWGKAAPHRCFTDCEHRTVGAMRQAWTSGVLAELTLKPIGSDRLGIQIEIIPEKISASPLVW
jgi:hypothetical protein